MSKSTARGLEVPPGSDEAIKHGCTCQRGIHYGGRDNLCQSVQCRISIDCPLHGEIVLQSIKSEVLSE